MAPSPHPQPRPLLALMAVLLGAACALGLAGLIGAGAHVAHADAQPALTVAVKPGGSTATQTQYTVTATGFPAGAAFTETLGDGSAIPPATGHVNSSGGFTLIWTLDAATKYCGTIAAQAGTASASASFWVALVSDSQSGTPCQGSGGGAGTPTPATSPTPNTTATPNATATPAAALPTTTPSAGGGSSGSGRLRAILAAIPWRWVGIGGGALLVLIVVMAISSALGKRQPGVSERTSARRAAMGGVARFGSRPGYSSSARQRAAQWQAPPTPTAQRYAPYDGAEPRRGPGGDAGGRRWPEDGPDHYSARRPPPDQRWTRSQPGARGERGGTSTRERAARRNAEWEQWTNRR